MNITCNFLYCNHQVYRDFLISLYLLTAIGKHPVAVLQNTFTNKQYTEQDNETEYTEGNTHNNKNT
jgi:hypothetical protein